MYEATQTQVPAPTADAPYIRMLTELASRTDQKAKDAGLGEVKSELKQIKERLLGVEVQFVPADPEDEPGEVYHIFAAGKHREHSMVKVQKVGPDPKYVFVSRSATALLSLIMGI